MQKFIVFSLVLALTVNTYAKDQSSNNGIPLSDVISAYANKSNEAVIVAEDVSGNVNLFGVDLENINYNILLGVLKLKGLSIYKTEDYLAIIPDHQSRIHNTEIFDGEKLFAPDQYITEIIPIKNKCANDFMPILKPLVHRHSFIEPVYSSNSIVIIDRYRNVITDKVYY